MNLNFPMLTPEQIEIKVKQVRDGNVALLLYKTARTDMDMLDKAVGPMNWESDYKEIKGNLYAGIGIRNDDGEMVWKWDCGTESRADGEGNEKKGEASDAFKRAGFKWGIGRELYTGPHIVAFVPTENYNGKLVLKEKHHKYDGFHVADIAYEDGKIVRLRIDDSQDISVYNYPKGESARQTRQAQARQERQQELAKVSDTVPMIAPGQATFILANVPPKIKSKLVELYGENLERMTKDKAAQYVEYAQSLIEKARATA